MVFFYASWKAHLEDGGKIEAGYTFSLTTVSYPSVSVPGSLGIPITQQHSEENSGECHYTVMAHLLAA